MEPGGDSFCLLHSIWVQLRRSEGQALPCQLGAGSLRSDAGCQLGPQLGGCWNTYICDLFVKFFCAGTFGLLHNVAGCVLSVGFSREQQKDMNSHVTSAILCQLVGTAAKVPRIQGKSIQTQAW